MAYADVTRQNLMDAFWKLYKEKGIRNITIKEVTDLAGYHRGTFYRHFSSLDEVLEKVEDPLLPSSPDYFPEGNTDPTRMISDFINYYLEGAEYLQTLMGPRGDPMFADKYVKVGKIAAERQYRKKLKVRNPELSLVLEFMFAGGFAMISKWYSDYRDGVNSDRIKEVMDAIYYEGCSTFLFGKRDKKEL